MSISLDDAKASLKQVEATMDASRTLASYAATDLIILTWGVIWFVGFLSDHFLTQPQSTLCEWSGPIWIVLIIIGIGASLWAGLRMPIQNTAGKRIGLLWAAIYAYVWLGVIFLDPFLNTKALGPGEWGKFMGAINSLIPMFAWVVMGLWFETNYLAWLGLLLSVLIAVGFFLFHGFFYLWMALVCGDIMILAGLYLCTQCRQARKTLAKELPHDA